MQLRSTYEIILVQDNLVLIIEVSLIQGVAKSYRFYCNLIRSETKMYMTHNISSGNTVVNWLMLHKYICKANNQYGHNYIICKAMNPLK